MIFDEFTLKSQIRAVPDFPKPGVVFRDITPLFQSPRALRMTVDSFVQRTSRPISATSAPWMPAASSSARRWPMR